MTGNGLKRKRASEPKFYAVHAGVVPGVYYNYEDCFAQVKGFKGAKFQSFTSMPDAENFVKNGLTTRTSSKAPTKFYGVQSGKVPGVYTSWDDASEQITGWTKPKYKSFTTQAEAEAYVNAIPTQNGDASMIDGETPKSTKSHKKKKVRDSGIDESIPYGPGDGPLPAGAQDGFDPSIHLDPRTQEVDYKSDEQFARTKWQADGMTEESSVKIWTDGSSRGNGTAGAVAGVGVYFGPNDQRNLAEPLAGPRQTNQRAELTAILRALELSPRDRPVTILSDSNYAINCVTTWFQKWRSNGWVNSSRKPVENKDLIEKILGYIEEREKISNLYSNGDDSLDVQEVAENARQKSFKKGRARVQFIWVKGHASEQGNVEADALAVAGSKKHGEEEVVA